MDKDKLADLLRFPNQEVRFGADVFRASIPPLWLWRLFRDMFQPTPLVDKQDHINVFLTYSESNKYWIPYSNRGERIRDLQTWQYFRPVLIPMTRDGLQVDEKFGQENEDGTILSGGYFRQYSTDGCKECNGVKGVSSICYGHTELYRAGPVLYEHSEEERLAAEKRGTPTLVPHLIYELGEFDTLYLGNDSELKWIAFQGILFCWDAIVQMKVGHISRIGYGPWTDCKNAEYKNAAWKNGLICKAQTD